MSANADKKNIKEEVERQEEDNYKNKYLELLYQVKRGKDAFDSLASNWWKDEARYVGENFEDCVIGMTEEEFEENSDYNADNVPIDNLCWCNYKDLRVLELLFVHLFVHLFSTDDE